MSIFIVQKFWKRLFFETVRHNEKHAPHSLYTPDLQNSKLFQTCAISLALLMQHMIISFLHQRKVSFNRLIGIVFVCVSKCFSFMTVKADYHFSNNGKRILMHHLYYNYFLKLFFQARKLYFLFNCVLLLIFHLSHLFWLDRILFFFL